MLLMSTADSNVSDGFSTAAFGTATTGSNVRRAITPGVIVLCTFLFAVVIVSTLANLFVLLSYKFEKKLRTTFAILIGNLAVTDLIVSAFPMFFFTINILFNYWPLGKVFCAIWVVFDYNCVFASSWMLAAISVDRLWSIKWSLHYRKYHTKKTAAIIVIAVWLLVFAITMYPIINDRIHRTKEYYCHFVPAENPKFVIALAFLGHHIPCIIIVVVYVIVFVEIRKLFKTRPQDKAAARSKAQRSAISVAPTTAISMSVACTAEPAPSTSKDTAIDHGTENNEIADNDKSKTTECAGATSGDNKKMDQKKEEKNEQPQQQQQRKAAGSQASSDAKTRADRERKSFVTLSYIVVGYVVCWVPFHFVYDVSFIRPELVSDDLYTATFWLTYVNSTINPFLYAFSSPDLRNAVIKMLKCRCSS